MRQLFSSRLAISLRHLAASSALCASLVQAAEPPLAPELKAQVERILQTSKASSTAIVLVDGLGVSGAHWQGDLKASTCQLAGAAGDALVAVAAMRLAERGKADVYAPLPRPAGAPSACKTKLTLGHLLEHTSGLPAACPGGQTLYNASGAALAAQVLEKTAKTNMAALMQREVFKPLGMQSSSWGSAPPSCQSVVKQHKKGLVSTPLDMASLVQMLVQRGQVETTTYLPQCAVERMGISVSAFSVPGGNTPAAINQAEFGFGLERFKVDQHAWLGYSGNLPGSQWVWAYSSQSQSGMVIMGHGLDTTTLLALRDVVARHLHKDAVLLTQR